ncbi:hypothetical protein WJX74_006501 [Apatococcus lobatus]|uniref:FAD-binding FR-type domain-containing protein n=1 Tax=Apatococcus lobatus TaxID=904363 RepID=A0AAW1S772_9CHLO
MQCNVNSGHTWKVRLWSHCSWDMGRRVFTGGLLAAAMIGCFLWRFLMYATGHPKAELWHQRLALYSWSLPIAKGFGQSSKLIFALILLPISRNTITFLRTTPLRHILHFNDAITVHQTLGWLGLVSVTGHTIAHVVDYSNQDARRRAALWQDANPGESQPTAAESMRSEVVITGIIMWVVILIAYPFAVHLPRSLTSRWQRVSSTVPAVPSCRALANHNWFYGTHHLFFIFYVALILHPRPAIPNEYHEWLVSDTWVWVSLPILIYVTERLLRGWRHYRWKIRLLDAKPMPAKILEVRLSKPRGFKAVAGQYIMLRCPRIALFEWHPFSLTSAPQEPFITLHIQAAGDWSSQLVSMFWAEAGHASLPLAQPEFPASQDPDMWPTAAPIRSETKPEASEQHQNPVHQPLTHEAFHTHSGPIPLQDRQLQDEFSAQRQQSICGPRHAGYLPAAPLHSMPRASPQRMQQQHSNACADTGVCTTSCGFQAPQRQQQQQHQHQQQQISDIDDQTCPAISNGCWAGDLDLQQQCSNGTDVDTGHPKECSRPAGTMALRQQQQQQQQYSSGTQDILGHCCNHTGRGPGLISIQQQQQQQQQKHSNDIHIITCKLGNSTRQDKGTHSHQHQQQQQPGESCPRMSAEHMGMEVIMDGPYGAPTQDHKHFRNLLLVGAGIGLTPMVSVLKSLLYERYPDHPIPERHAYPLSSPSPVHCAAAASSKIMVTHSDVEQGVSDAHGHCIVYWSVRDEDQILWCTETLKTILARDTQGFLEVHVHVTGTSVSFAPTSRVGHQIRHLGSDIILTRGRPVWDEVFARLAREHPRTAIGVFFCGPQKMANELQVVSRRTSRVSSTKFKFHQEQF